MHHFKKHHNVTIYTEPGSKFCELAKEYFRGVGVDYFELDVSRDQNSRAKMIEITGQKQTPVIDFDGRIILGFRPDIFDLLMAEKSTDGMV